MGEIAENPYNILAVDHGNYGVKTPLESFSCALRSDTLAPSMTDEYVTYHGLKWYIGSDYPAIVRDKTSTDNMYVQTLIALGREARKGCIDLKKPVNLAIGLPPLHIHTEKSAYEKYFRSRDGERLIYCGENGVPVHFGSIRVFPQGYAAYTYATMKGLLPESADMSSFLIVDIGGGTIDSIYFRNKKPCADLCQTDNNGVNFLIDTILRDINNDLELAMNQSNVEDILLGRRNAFTTGRNKDSELAKAVRSTIRRDKQAYVTNMISHITNNITGSRAIPWVFAGGGAKLLRSEIEKVPYKLMPVEYDFLDDPQMNAKGYHLMAELMLKAGG